MTAVLRGGKRQVGGKVAYAGSIRCKDALLCCHGALGRALAWFFTLERNAFPSPLDRQVWLEQSAIWQGAEADANISYNQHYAVLKSYLRAAGIVIRKVTHAWRMFKARDLDEQGVPDEVRVGGAPGGGAEPLSLQPAHGACRAVHALLPAPGMLPGSSSRASAGGCARR